MSATAPRPLRADAVRNRERVVAAAAAVFAERGIEASVPDIAARPRKRKFDQVCSALPYIFGMESV